MEKNIYKASIDTTFALYKPNAKGGWQLPALRIGGKYIARHLPWYSDTNNFSEEENFYIEKSTSSSSWYKRNEIYE